MQTNFKNVQEQKIKNSIPTNKGNQYTTVTYIILQEEII